MSGAADLPTSQKSDSPKKRLDSARRWGTKVGYEIVKRPRVVVRDRVRVSTFWPSLSTNLYFGVIKLESSRASGRRVEYKVRKS